MTSVQRYRDRAARARRLAAAITDDSLQEQIELVAREYEDLAAQMEQGRPSEEDQKKGDGGGF